MSIPCIIFLIYFPGQNRQVSAPIKDAGGGFLNCPVCGKFMKATRVKVGRKVLHWHCSCGAEVNVDE